MHSFDDVNARGFDWKELNGKSLTIHVGSDEGEDGKSTIVIGKDEETGVYYILHHEYQSPSSFKINDKPVYSPSTKFAASYVKENLEKYVKRYYTSTPFFTSHRSMTDEEIEEYAKSCWTSSPKLSDADLEVLRYSLMTKWNKEEL